MNKKEKLIFFILCLMALIFLISANLLDVRRQDTYESRDRIALYIFKYRKLPSNYILLDNNSPNTTKDVIADGYSFGGMQFENREGLIDNPDNNHFIEADYYPSREMASKEGRGVFRLVFTEDGKKRVLYTENHYESFNELSYSKLKAPSRVMWILFVIPYSGIIVMVIGVQTRSNRRKEE